MNSQAMEQDAIFEDKYGPAIQTHKFLPVIDKCNYQLIIIGNYRIIKDGTVELCSFFCLSIKPQTRIN